MSGASAAGARSGAPAGRRVARHEEGALSEQTYREAGGDTPGVTSVAVIDDDLSLRSALRSLFHSYGLTVRLFSSAEDFLSAVDYTAGCLIIDVRMPGMSGLELQRYLLAHGRRTPAVFISAHDDRVARLEAAEAGALAFLHKPFTADSMMAAVGSALGRDASDGSVGADGSGERRP